MKPLQVTAIFFLLLGAVIFYAQLNANCNKLREPTYSNYSAASHCEGLVVRNSTIAVVMIAVSGGFLGISLKSKKGFFSRATTNSRIDAPPQASSLSPFNSAPASQTSIEQELQKAKDMLDKGLIDEEEFKLMKKKIIERS